MQFFSPPSTNIVLVWGLLFRKTILNPQWVIDPTKAVTYYFLVDSLKSNITCEHFKNKNVYFNVWYVFLFFAGFVLCRVLVFVRTILTGCTRSYPNCLQCCCFFEHIFLLYSLLFEKLKTNKNVIRNVCYVLLFCVFCAVLCVSVCAGHFVMVPFNLTCSHYLQHLSLDSSSIYITYSITYILI